MRQVRVLPDDLIDQIAAGEVVERPASVVKELVENSLDAEATRVDVAIRGGGARWIRVTDDGIGMAPRDAGLAFERHATSKIASQSDLASVASLGFRGEALASIAAVARVRMRTRRAEDALGVELAGEGAGISRVSQVACPEGTSVEVAELFERIPARLKFLKSPVTESGQIVRWLERIALARPDIRLSLERDDKPSFLFLPTADPRERAIAVLPPRVGSSLVGVEGQTGNASLRGYATPTDVFRGSTADIHVFVNGRPVRDRLLLHLVRQAYSDALPPGRFPAAVLYLSVAHGDVDVNVHPAKWEVRFRDPGEIRQLIREGLIRAIGLRGGRSSTFAQTPAHSLARDAAPPELGFTPPRPLGPEERVRSRLADAAAVFDALGPGPPDGEPRPRLPFHQHRYLGQLLGTYLVLEGDGALVLLDQHAAHERVLFERMRTALLKDKPERQALLAPIWTELPRSAADAIEGATDLLGRVGLEVELEGATARGSIRVAIRSVPAALAGRSVDWEAMLGETAGQLVDPAAQETRGGLDAVLHGVLATTACHAAVRKHDRLQQPEVEALLQSLDEIVWVPNCPHGRPIALTLGEAEIERRMLRR
jgi:DNA mismatch repair protein MutL